MHMISSAIQIETTDRNSSPHNEADSSIITPVLIS